ncbi:putative cytokinetic ring protein SteA [Kineococcus gynurae]|uniref:Cytokinetic ring protein SteA n=1 Tax=Kineococcus gynurae TaxID=452979 RepID=A0ABV5LXQ2_9ACTN
MRRRGAGRAEDRARSVGSGVPSGLARVDRRTKRLTKRLRPGEVAVIDHLDLDRVSAEALVACSPAAVVNASPSTSGRYPNLGPEILVGAGIPVLDAVGPEVMTAVREGRHVEVGLEELRVDGEVVGRGRRLTPESVAVDMEAARAGLSLQLEAFAANTMEYLRRERELLLDGVGVPEISTVIEGRHVLIVVRGYGYKEDLVTLRPYVREYKPLLIGVDGGADAILEAGWRPDLIVGDMDSVSDAALRSGAEIVVHAYRDGRAPGLERVHALGIDAVVFPATGTSEDVAMLLADDKGASLIAAVGTHVTLVEFLDKGRAGMASTFLTRLRVGGKLVDAKGVSRLYHSRVSDRQVAILVLAGVLALLAALAVTPTGQAILVVTGARLEGFWADLMSVLSDP